MAKPKPLKTAARVVVSIARHHLEEFLGKETLGILASAQTEDGKKRPDALIDDWLNAPGAQKDIEAAIEKADACVLKRCKDREIQQIALQLPLRRLPKLVEVIAGLPEATDELALEDAVRGELQTTASKLAPGLVDVAIKAYMDCLHLALLPVEKQALIVIGRSNLRIEEILREVLSKLERLEQELQRTGTDTKPLRELLEVPPHFKDRKRELKKLLADLKPGRIATLCGAAGTGKSSLAAVALSQLTDNGAHLPADFPDGVLVCYFYHQPQVNLALEKIARCYHEEPIPTPAQAAQRALANRQTLLVLDGAEEADDLQAVLKIRGRCGVLITSRDRLDIVEAEHGQDIIPLKLSYALALLKDWCGGKSGSGEIASRICKAVDCLPIAIRLAGSYLNSTDEQPEVYADWLERQPLAALHLEERSSRSVNVLLARSLDQVSSTAQQALAVSGRLALSSFRVQVVSAALQIEDSTARQALGELARFGLLNRHGEECRLSHRLLHIYAHDKLTLADEAMQRLAGYYTQLAKSESAKGPQGYRRLDEERPHLMRVLEGYVAEKRWQAARLLVWAVRDYLDMQGHWTEQVSALQAGVAAARQANDRYDEMAFLNSLGLAYYSLGQVEKAIEHYQQVLPIARETGDRRGEGAILGNLGNAYIHIGQVETAIEYYQQALAIDREIDDRRGEGADLGNLGLAYRHLGQVEKAIKYHEQALAIAHEIGDRRGEGADLGNLGLAYSHLGQVEKAIDYYQQALAIVREIGDRGGEGTHLGNLGNSYSHLGQVQKAKEYLCLSLAIFEEIKSPTAEQVRQWLAKLDRK